MLFLCVHNSGRSQMALGFFHHRAGGQALAWSGGSEPVSGINSVAVAAMAEIGIDIKQEFPKPWTAEFLDAAGIVVTMGCGDTCPSWPASTTRTGNWTSPTERRSNKCEPSVTRSAATSTNSWIDSAS